VAAFRLDELALEDEPLGIVRRSLARTGVVVLGESHGVADTPRAILTVMRRVGARALALEWSYDEVGEIVQALLSTGRLDLDELWRIPAGGDLFAGDGRFTAGHVALLEHLVAAGELQQVILVDRLAAEGAEREREMAARLLESLRPGVPTIGVVGHAHAARERIGGAESMFAHVERALPGVANGVLAFRSGTCHHRGESEIWPIAVRTDAVFELGAATPAVVPARSPTA
jgi:hypothetical protein